MSNLVFLRIRNRSSLCGFDWQENSEEGLRQLKKVYMSSKRNLCILVCERKKINSFEITVIIFKVYKKCKSPIQKGFLKGLLAKTYLFLYFRDCPKNGEGNKRDVESICERVTKHASKKVAKAKKLDELTMNS